MVFGRKVFGTSKEGDEVEVDDAVKQPLDIAEVFPKKGGELHTCADLCISGHCRDLPCLNVLLFDSAKVRSVVWLTGQV